MPLQATKTRSTSFQQPRRTGKGTTLDITSQSIASDLAAFRKQGGRIEILGTTPLRPNVTAFSSKGNTQRKTKPVSMEKSAARG
ncbi:MAG: hypothetical protein ABI538_05225 [Pseudoxanthomonas sp.]